MPESGNGVPDILDEARWELEFLLSMQVPAGKPLAGMAHHKIHDATWTGLPLLPHHDPQPRELHPPSTAATLNLAATAAQAARALRPVRRGLRGRAPRRRPGRPGRRRKANPAIYAAPADGNGGGAYDDTNVTDEFYWAAAELYLTTGERAVPGRGARLAACTPATSSAPSGFDWQGVAPLGRLDLATVPNAPARPGRGAGLGGGGRRAVPGRAGGAPVRRCRTRRQGGIYDWGSNNLVLNNLVVLATAYDLTGRRRATATAC